MSHHRSENQISDHSPANTNQQCFQLSTRVSTSGAGFRPSAVFSVPQPKYDLNYHVFTGLWVARKGFLFKGIFG